MLKQPILVELQNFLNGVNSLNGNRNTKFVGHDKLIKCSLILLSDLPAARSVREVLFITNYTIKSFTFQR